MQRNLPRAAEKPYALRRGVSFVEVLVASTILVTLSLIVYRIFLTGQQSTDKTSLTAYLHNQARTTMETLSRDIAEARVTAVGASNESVTLQIPVDHDGDDDVIDDAGALEYGYRDPAGGPSLNWSATFVAVAESALSESGVGIDINRDGDQNDTFSVCRLEKVVLDDLAAERDRLIVSRDVFQGDMDGDGTADPLFVLDGTKVAIHLWLGKKAGIAEYVLFDSKVEIKLRNPQ